MASQIPRTMVLLWISCVSRTQRPWINPMDIRKKLWKKSLGNTRNRQNSLIKPEPKTWPPTLSSWYFPKRSRMQLGCLASASPKIQCQIFVMSKPKQLPVWCFPRATEAAPQILSIKLCPACPWQITVPHYPLPISSWYHPSNGRLRSIKLGTKPTERAHPSHSTLTTATCTSVIWITKNLASRSFMPQMAHHNWKAYDHLALLGMPRMSPSTQKYSKRFHLLTRRSSIKLSPCRTICLMKIFILIINLRMKILLQICRMMRNKILRPTQRV